MSSSPAVVLSSLFSQYFRSFVHIITCFETEIEFYEQKCIINSTKVIINFYSKYMYYQNARGVIVTIVTVQVVIDIYLFKR